MGIKISELPQASQLTSDDIIPIVQSGETKKVSVTNVITNSHNTNQANTYSSDYINNNFNKVNVQTSQTTSATDTYSCNYIDNKIKNEYNTSTTEGYSSNYINNKIEELNTYSTEEQRIGTWIGKPLYRKTFNVGTLPNAGSKSFETDLDWSICKTTNISGCAIHPTGGSLPLNFANPLAAGEMIGCRQTGTNKITIYTGADRSSYTGYVTLEYTKTTD